VDYRDIAGRLKDALPPRLRSELRRIEAALTRSHLSAPIKEVVATPRVHTSFPPVVDKLPFPLLDRKRHDLGMHNALESPEFKECENFFNSNALGASSLISSVSRAILYTLVRNSRPEVVIEIGTYRAGTTQVLARALHANGTGRVYTVDPYNTETISAILAQWPEELKQFVRHYPLDSMAFFSFLVAEKLRPTLVFIDGNHDYEFARFDIESCARVLLPGGLVIIDNVDQAGPFFAVRDFLERNPAWHEIGDGTSRFRRGLAFDPERSALPGTTFAILVGPDELCVGARPVTSGQADWPSSAVFAGVSVEPSRPATGTLSVQCVFRAFPSAAVPSEDAACRSIEIDGRIGTTIVPMPPAWSDNTGGRRTLEIWLSWEGPGELALACEPRPVSVTELEASQL
jgi:predicted O-methyltransferase YrrM